MRNRRASHALIRLIERCPGFCPGVLHRKIQASVASGSDLDAEFIGACYLEPLLGWFRFRPSGDVTIYCLCNIISGQVVTVLPCGFRFRTCHGSFIGHRNHLEPSNG